MRNKIKSELSLHIFFLASSNKYENTFFTLSFAITISGCAQSHSKSEKKSNNTRSSTKITPNAKAYFASGCFWCVEAIFESVNGVEDVISGYAGGTTQSPTYQIVSAGKTDHAESVEVNYDSTIISFETLVDVFFNSHDPSTLNRQGPDAGTQYRSIAFYSSSLEKTIIKTKISTLKQQNVFAKIATEIKKIDIFYPAEDYHQNYEKSHPNNPYVRSVSIPRLNKFKEKMPQILKKF